MYRDLPTDAMKDPSHNFGPTTILDRWNEGAHRLICQSRVSDEIVAEYLVTSYVEYGHLIASPEEIMASYSFDVDSTLLSSPDQVILITRKA
jgi:hypothetical protein